MEPYNLENLLISVMKVLYLLSKITSPPFSTNDLFCKEVLKNEVVIRWRDVSLYLF